MTPKPPSSAGGDEDVAVIGTGVQPQTPRGRRTRDALIAAARIVFERDGVVDSRLVDIAAEAGCSVGTVYTWFEGKDEIFAAVLEQAQSDLMNPGAERADASDPVAVIGAANRAYFEAYGRHARLTQLLNQMAVGDERFRGIRIARSDAFVQRNAAAIADLQRDGLADPDLDPELASMALSAMMSRLAADVHLFGLRGRTADEVVETATRVWTNALGLTRPDTSRPA